MKIETLKSRKRKYFLYVLIVGVVLLLPLVLSITFGKYQTRESIKLAEGIITYKPNELNIVAVNIEGDNGEYTYIEDIPTSGYYLDDSKSYCEVKGEKDNSILIQYSNNKLEVSDISKKGTRCYAYFNKTESKICPSGASACETIMENTNTIGERTDFSKTITATSTGIMYKTEDDYGTSYYFAGNPSDNWVKFAGFYWRIIRINGDGSIRMIYSGDETSGPTTTGLATLIGKRKYSYYYYDNAYVGYKYTLGEVHGTGTDSTIKVELDTWYNNNLESYASNIANGNAVIFCNDRQPSTERIKLNGLGGTGVTDTFYAAYIRLVEDRVPTLKCADSGDRFSTSIGLITVDEVSYAGGVFQTTNQNYYLYTDHNYWTMSPYYFNSFYNRAYVFGVQENGQFNWNEVSFLFGVRPVINLKSDTAFANGGMGTSSNPYVVS